MLLPTIPASAGALIRARKGRLLILKPTYKGGWTVPGGVVEIGESPWEACRRETREECGLDVTSGRLDPGAVFDLTDAGRAADAFKVRRVARTLEDRQEIWNAPLIFGLVLMAVFMEWVLRKKYRMV